MERLTEKVGHVMRLKREAGGRSIDMDMIVKNLADYEDAEESGRLIKLSCAVGDTVYRINKGAEKPIIPMGVTAIVIKGCTDTFKEIECKEYAFGDELKYRFTDIGKTVFLTREAAEAKLNKIKEE